MSDGMSRVPSILIEMESEDRKTSERNSDRFGHTLSNQGGLSLPSQSGRARMA
jgi:hypothetical protein